MRAIELHSHLNGIEHIEVHKPAIWADIQDAIAAVAPAPRATEMSERRTKRGRGIYRARQLNRLFEAELTKRGWTRIGYGNPTDFIRDRIAIELRFSEYAFVAYDLFVKHMAFYIGDLIDVGVEILPMKELQAEMSSGVAYYEGELYNVLRQGRNTPAVPLVLLGVAV